VGIELSGSFSGDVELRDNINIRSLEDAYIICFTDRYEPDTMPEAFGRYCVEIRDSKAFFFQIDAVLKTRFKIESARLARVTYRDRHFFDLEPENVPLGFLKAPDEYSDQREVRMLWKVFDPSGLVPIVLAVPSVRGLCRRVA
jgi:hypothetical protein